MRPLSIRRLTLASALGVGLAATLAGLREHRSGLTRCRFETATLDTWVGEVPGVDAVRIAPALAAERDCRNNRLAQLALDQDRFLDDARACVRQFGPERVGVFLGTSTSGILETEQAYRQRDAQGRLPDTVHYAGAHNTFSVSDYVRHVIGAEGPAFTIAAACASSAKVFGAAARMIAANLIDAAIVGGVDSLCLTTLYGFNALELISPDPCRPFDVNRRGLSIGEAAGFALLERAPARPDPAAVLFAGYGESSDAHHMSAPHPQGAGAHAAMTAALARAGLTAADIDYVNLHGTGTPSNDLAEDKAVIDLFGARVPVSSIKGAAGHTLGAAGIVNAVVSVLAIEQGLLPGGKNTLTVDPALRSRYLLSNHPARVDRVITNAFGFGGSNCSLVFGRADCLPNVRIMH